MQIGRFGHGSLSTTDDEQIDPGRCALFNRKDDPKSLLSGKLT
jgi:hypothetical protein